jgi:hypothetical protein
MRSAGSGQTSRPCFTSMPSSDLAVRKAQPVDRRLQHDVRVIELQPRGRPQARQADMHLPVVPVLLARLADQQRIAPIVAKRTPGRGRVQALAARAVWRDIGAGTGPLAAGLLLPIMPSFWLYAVSAACLAVSAMACVGK